MTKPVIEHKGKMRSELGFVSYYLAVFISKLTLLLLRRLKKGKYTAGFVMYAPTPKQRRKGMKLV